MEKLQPMVMENQSENELRADLYKKDDEIESFLEMLNNNLTTQEQKLLAENTQTKNDHPIYFVVGLPRSGTTLVSQILTNAGDVGYINNFIARFWKCPLVGIKLYQSIYENREIDKCKAFNSNLGATCDVHDIHEFAYFWQRWLALKEDINCENINDSLRKINWDGLANVLNAIAFAFNKPLVMRNNLGFHHAVKFNQKLKNIKWIYIERDPVDVACSIFEARKRYYKNPASFWGTKPPNYKQHFSSSPEEQILNQVCELRKFYNSQLNSLPESSVVKLAFEEVVRTNGAVFDDLRIPFYRKPQLCLYETTNKYKDHPFYNFFLQGLREYEGRNTSA